jgi:D-alanyl-D-alanine dipeptidase
MLTAGDCMLNCNHFMHRFFLQALLFLQCLLFAFFSLASNIPGDFVYIEDIIPDIKLEIRYFSENNFVGQRIDGYEKPGCILTKKAALALKEAQAELAAFGFGLKVYDCYRPQRAVDHFVRWAKDLGNTRMKSQYYPDVDKQDLFNHGYIAEKSGHSRGSTVDLTIVSLDPNDPEELDMGTAWDYFGPQSWPSSMEVNVTQRVYRMLLRMVMTKHGYNPLKEEWWHFTLADEPFPDTYFDFVVK